MDSIWHVWPVPILSFVSSFSACWVTMSELPSGRGRQRCGETVAPAARQWEQEAAFTQDKGLVVYLPISRYGFSVNFTASNCNWEEVNYIIHTTTWCVHAG